MLLHRLDLKDIYISTGSACDSKLQLTDELEKEVVAFLNYHDGGDIYIGVDDDKNNE